MCIYIYIERVTWCLLVNVVSFILACFLLFLKGAGEVQFPITFNMVCRLMECRILLSFFRVILNLKLA